MVYDGPHALKSSGGEFEASNARANTSSTAPGRAAALWLLLVLLVSYRPLACGISGTGFKPFDQHHAEKLGSLRRRLVHVPLEPDELHVDVGRLDVVPPLRLQERDDDALQRDRFDKTRS